MDFFEFFLHKSSSTHRYFKGEYSGAPGAPVFTLFEKVVLSKFEFNLPTHYYTNTCDGSHCPGGILCTILFSYFFSQFGQSVLENGPHWWTEWASAKGYNPSTGSGEVVTLSLFGYGPVDGATAIHRKVFDELNRFCLLLKILFYRT